MAEMYLLSTLLTSRVTIILGPTFFTYIYTYTYIHTYIESFRITNYV
jgi:hypothetical protein